MQPSLDKTTAAPETGEAGRPRARISGVLLLIVIAALEAWALWAADPDFPLMDPFHWIALFVVAVYVIGLLFRQPVIRLALFTVAIGFPVIVLAMEWYVWSKESGEQDRIVVSDDVVLRYTYEAGAELPQESAADEGPTHMTADGLWDLPRDPVKPPGTRRIIVLGDSVPNDPSIPFGQRFQRRLEALLLEDAPAGTRPEVINVSCEGYNTIQEERLLEKVGLKYKPDLVVVAYVLNDVFLQNGAYRRLGNSFFAFRYVPLLWMASGNSFCKMFSSLYSDYAFGLVVTNTFERLRMVAEREGFGVLVAPLPIVERFDDPDCLALYDRVVAAAHAQGFAATRVVDAFDGEDFRHYLKPHDRFDVTHPNARGHERIAQALAESVRPLLQRRESTVVEETGDVPPPP